jgi:ribokinase
MKNRIVVVGSLNMDMTVFTERLPQTGETILGSDFKTSPGGKGANQAVAAARAGAQVSMIGKVGADDFGRALIANLNQNKVNTTCVLTAEQKPTGTALISVDAEGKNTIVVVPGSNFALTPEDVRRCAGVIAEADVILLQLEVPMETVLEAAKIAREHQVKVFLNPAPARELPEALLQQVDVLLPNETETALLTGLPVETDPDLKAAASSLKLKGVENVLITCGKRGVYWVGQDEDHFEPAFVVKSVDSTAAGDSFIGSFAAAIVRDHSLREALRWGNAAGALTVTRKGAQDALPSETEVQAFLAEH